MVSYLLDNDVELRKEMNELRSLFNIVIERKLNELRKSGKSEQEIKKIDFLYCLDLEAILANIEFDGVLKRKRILKKLREKITLYNIIDENIESCHNVDNLLCYRKFFQSRVDDGLSNDCDNVDSLVFKMLMMNEQERERYFKKLDKKDQYDIKKSNDRLVFLECLKKDLLEKIQFGKLKNNVKTIEAYIYGKLSCYNAGLRDYSLEEKKEVLQRILESNNPKYIDLNSILNSAERFNRIKLELFFDRISDSIKKV